MTDSDPIPTGTGRPRYPSCVRCSRRVPVSVRWPEGPLCKRCRDAARTRVGVCADCGYSGPLPGRNANGQPTCRRCGGVPGELTCPRCGNEEVLARKGECWRCLLTDRVTELLTGPEGSVPDHLAPLATSICAMRRAQSGHIWLRDGKPAPVLLQDLAHGRLPCEHAAFDGYPPSQAVEHLRGLLTGAGILPRRDKRIAAFTRWTSGQLAGITDPEQRRLVERFARWHLLRGLRRHADAAPLPIGPYLRARQALTVTIDFLAWLQARGHTLAECTQHDIDAWFAEGPSTREHAVRFLGWARRQRLLRGIDLPRTRRDSPRLIGETDRLAALRTLLVDETLAPSDRVAGCLIALFGQPVNRIITLRTTDVDLADEQVQIQLGRHWITVPEPAATLLRTHLVNRPNMNTAANPTSPWLFPGLRAGEHRTHHQAARALREAGIPVQALRNTTWQQLARDAPPQILADALGISPAMAMRHATRAGADWTRYAALAAASKGH